MSTTSEQSAIGALHHRLAVAICGCGHEGRLGTGSDVNVESVELLPFFLHHSQDVGEVLSIHAGGYHTFVRTTTGVFGWGSNRDGQLGLEGASGELVANPTRIPFFGDGSSLRELACGGDHTLALTDDGLYACGSNNFGQLGLGDNDSRRRFTRVSRIDVVVPPWLLAATSKEASPDLGRTDGLKDIVWQEWRRPQTRVPNSGVHAVNELGSTSAAPLSLPSLNDATGSKNRNAESLLYRATLACGDELSADQITHISCGTNHSVIALKDVKIPVGSAAGTDGKTGGCLVCPFLLAASGSGDYGELGFDDEKCVQVPHQGKKRRPPFQATHFRSCFHPLFSSFSWFSASSAQELQATNTSSSSEILCKPSLRLADVRAMHLHTAFSLSSSDPSVLSDLLRHYRNIDENDAERGALDSCGSEFIAHFHFGCYYDGSIEGLESSEPRLLEGDAQWGNAFVHAGDDMLLRYTRDPPRGFLAKLDVCGQGTLLEERQVSFTPYPGFPSAPRGITLRHSGTHVRIASISTVTGRDHFLVLARGVKDEPDQFLEKLVDAPAEVSAQEPVFIDVVFGFGENLHGQLGFPDGTTSVKAEEAWVERTDTSDLERRKRCGVEECGQLNLCLISGQRISAHTSQKPSATHGSGSRWPFSSAGKRIAPTPDEPVGYTIERIVDVAAGARHSVFLVQCAPPS